MPKRSNDFQRLVYLVRVNLAGGATVTESKMMRDRLTKRFREVVGPEQPEDQAPMRLSGR